MPKYFYKQNKFFIFSYSLFIVVFLAFSFYFYVNEKKNENLKNREYLHTLTKIKSSEIQQWYGERFSDALLLYSNNVLKEELSKYSGSHLTADSVKIINLIEQVYKNHDYKNILIIDLNFQSLINLNPETERDFKRDSINSAVYKNKIVFSNFYKNSFNSKIDLDIYIPLLKGKKSGFIVILKIDPYELIFPLIQNWYVEESSAESFIVYSDGDSVVFINRLKFNSAPPLSLKLPVSSKDLPAAMAVKGIQGVV